MEKTLLILAALAVFAVHGEDDLTMENFAVGTEVVEATLDIIDTACIFSDNKLMLRRIAKLETDDGLDDDTFEKNGVSVPGGIWRADENKLRDISTVNDYNDAIEATFGIDWSTVTIEDMTIPLYSALAARIWIDTYPTKGYDIPWGQAEQAAYWVTYYHSGSTVTVQDYLDVIDDLAGTCDSSVADMVFVLDGSGSIGAQNFVTMKDFVDAVVDAFDVRDNGVRIGVIQYSGDSQTEFYLGEVTGKSQVKTAVQRIEYKTGSTNTAAALDDLRDMFIQYGRPSVPQLGIVMTDGQSNDAAKTAAAAQEVKDDAITVFAVGVTSGAVMSELRSIGSDPDCVHVHLLDTFADISPFTTTIQNQACRAPAQLLPEEDYEGDVVTGMRVFFKLKIKRRKRGLTIKLRVRSGATRLFISFKARNPGRAVFKYRLRVDSSLRQGGRIFIPFPDDITDVDETYVYAALLGEGYGQKNYFNIGMDDGDTVAGDAVRPGVSIMTMVLATMLLVANAWK